jgi:hypothetical protein
LALGVFTIGESKGSGESWLIDSPELKKTYFGRLFGKASSSDNFMMESFAKKNSSTNTLQNLKSFPGMSIRIKGKLFDKKKTKKEIS